MKYTAVIHQDDLVLTYMHAPDEETTVKVSDLTEANYMLYMTYRMYGIDQNLDVIA